MLLLSFDFNYQNEMCFESNFQRVEYSRLVESVQKVQELILNEKEKYIKPLLAKVDSCTQLSWGQLILCFFRVLDKTDCRRQNLEKGKSYVDVITRISLAANLKLIDLEKFARTDFNAIKNHHSRLYRSPAPVQSLTGFQQPASNTGEHLDLFLHELKDQLRNIAANCT